ncbi:M23 family metallopeptidase [Specibacter sp. RAF43]|uniref:M23 family metallopeptidase n=1 Tax=Specibacter sp. RAF43 TaxID=3233057 RepID=UPI003F9BA0AD
MHRIPRSPRLLRAVAAALLAALVAVLPGPAAGSSWSLPAANAAPPGSVQPRATAARPLPARLAWGWPLSPTPRVVHVFDPPAKPWLGGHRGVDLLAAQGTPILAPTDAVVAFAGVVADRPVLTLVTAGGLRLSFEPAATRLAVGDAVTRGSEIGTLAGRTHCDTGAPGEESCLHWGVRRKDHYLNPLQFILDLRPSILLPLAN